MLQLSPIYLDSAAAVYADHFERRLFQQRMSSLGHWRGRGAQPLGLQGPVELKALENLLAGFTRDGDKALVADSGDPKRIACWRATLIAEPLLNNFWAVVPKEARLRTERGFAQAVGRTLRRWENLVTGVGHRAPTPEHPKALMAVFRTQAAADASPQLKATALLLNVGLGSPQNALTFSPSWVMATERPMEELFQRALISCLHGQWQWFKGAASRVLDCNRMLQQMSARLDRDADSRWTWGRRDERSCWEGESRHREWAANTQSLERRSQVASLVERLEKPGEVWRRPAGESRKTPATQPQSNQGVTVLRPTQPTPVHQPATQPAVKQQSIHHSF